MLLHALTGQGRAIGVASVSAMAGFLLLGVLGFGYGRQVKIIRVKNDLATEPGEGSVGVDPA